MLCMPGNLFLRLPKPLAEPQDEMSGSDTDCERRGSSYERPPPPVPCRGVPGASSHGKFSKLKFLDLGHSGILDRTPQTPPPLGPLQKCYCKRCMSDSSVFFCVVHRSSKLCSSHQFLKGRRARTHCKPGKSCVRSFLLFV